MRRIIFALASLVALVLSSGAGSEGF